MPSQRGAEPDWPHAGTGDAAPRATEFARAVAARTDSAERVHELLLHAGRRTSQPIAWHPPGLADGYAGLALLHLYAARAGVADFATAFAYVREAIAATRSHPLSDPGLFCGTSGLAMALADCARDEPRWGPSVDRMHDQLGHQVMELDYPRVERCLSAADYDVVAGAAGVLCYASSVPDPNHLLRTAIATLTDYLIWLSEPAASPWTPRRWLITPDRYPPEPDYRASYPHGYLDLGMAHGIPGVLTALAAAWRAGHRRPGHRQALLALTSWIRESSVSDEDGIDWPVGRPVDEGGRELPGRPGDTRPAWAHGGAGVSGALLTTAEATGDLPLRALAVEAFEAALRRARRQPPVTPTLRHGLSGVLLLCLEFAAVSSAARAAVPVLLEELLGHGDPERPLVFADRLPTGEAADGPGLLTGAVGVALTLLAAAGTTRPYWFLAFLGW